MAFPTTHRREALEKVLKELRRRMRISLSRQGKNSSGNLSRSLEYDITKDNGELLGRMFGPDYADFVNKGVRGSKRSPYPGQKDSPYKFGSGRGGGGLRRGIDRWVVQKPISDARDSRGRFVPRKSMVFLISRAVYERGLKPSFFIDKTLERMEQKIRRAYEDALEKDIQEYLDNPE